MLEGFPDLGHDDEVDACSGALEMLNPNSKDWGFIRFMDEQARQMREKQEQQKPEPVKTNYAVGSLEWQRENQKRIEAERAAAAEQG